MPPAPLRVVPALTVLGLALGGAGAARAISINVSYSGFNGSEQAVMDQAKAYWEAAVSSAQVFTVTAQKTALTGGLLGRASNYVTDPPGGPGTGGAPAGGTIEIDSATPFFVDPTPAANGEYVQNVSPPTFYQATDPLSPAFGAFDLLTVALHEFGHVLGFTSAFPQFASHIQASADSAQNVWVFASTPAIGSPAFYLAGTGANNLPFGGIYMPQSESEEAAEEASSGSLPSHLDETLPTGTSAAFLSLDLMTPTLGAGERRLISFADLDVLADAYGYAVVPEPCVLALWSLALAGFAAARARRPARGPA